MPFSQKKQLATNEYGQHWIEFGGTHYYSVFSAVSGNTYARVYDSGGNSILNVPNQAIPIFLFSINSQLFASYYVSSFNSYIIYRRDGGSWTQVAALNSGSKLLDYKIVSNVIYMVIAGSNGAAQDVQSKLCSFNGSSLTTIRSSTPSSTYISAFDINTGTGDYIFAEHSLSSTNVKIIKRTTDGAETELISLAFARIATLKLFNSNVHYFRQDSSNFGKLCRLDSLDAGANEIIISDVIQHSFGSGGNTIDFHNRSILFESNLWFNTRASVNGFTILSKYYDGSSITSFQAIIGQSFPGYFYVNVDELILGTYQEFVTTEVACDLTLSSPSYTKTNETGTDLDDGTITAHATSSFSIQYSIDNGANWQSSNLFENLTPGTYDILIRDSQLCEQEITGIVISAFNAPEPEPEVEGGNLVIDLKPVNRYNFILWFAAEGNTGFDRICLDNSDWDLPNLYQRTSVQNKHYPVICYGELFSFYLNFTDAFTDPDFVDFRLALINDNGIVSGYENIATLSKDQYDDDTLAYNIYAEDVTLSTGTPAGYYRLAIYNSTNGQILYVSNELQLMTVANAKKETVRIQWRHEFNIYKYYYQNVPDYVHNLRLKLNEIERQSEGELTQYRSVSGGDLRNQGFELDMYVVFETNYFDKLAHQAMFVFQAHQTIIINEEQYVLKSMYKVESSPEKVLNRGKIEFYLQSFSTINRYGPLVDITIIGSEDDILGADGGDLIGT